MHSFKRFRLPALALAILASLLGCGGGGDGEIPLKAPTDLEGVWMTDGPTSAQFTWTVVQSIDTFDGYYLEGQFGTGPYVNLMGNGYLPAAMYSFPVTIDPAAGPELQPFNVRLKAFRGLVSPKYATSNVTSLVMPVRQAGPITIENAPVGLKVTWTNSSSVADSLLLERGVCRDGNGMTYTWTTIPGVPASATSHEDKDAAEAAFVKYRVTYAKGQARSYPRTSDYVMTYLRAPEGLTATAGTEGVRLAWTNASLTASSLVVKRSTGIGSGLSFHDIATLPGSATSYDDPGLPPGAYTYVVEAQVAGFSGGTRSAYARVATLPATLSDLRLQPAIVNLPSQATAAAPGLDGAWWLAGTASYTFYVQRPVGGAWTTQEFPNLTSVYRPQLCMDAQGRPHFVYTRPVTAGGSTYVLLHAWHDGTDWQTEEIARPVPSGYDQRFYLDAQGQPVVLWRGFTGGISPWGVAFKDGSGTWKVEDPTASLSDGSFNQAYNLAPDASGLPLLLLGKGGNLYLVRRGGDGLWTAEALPAGRSPTADADLPAIASTPDGDVHVVYSCANVGAGMQDEVVYLRRSAGTWSQPAALSSPREFHGYGPFVTSPAGDRLAFMAMSDEFMTLFVLDQGSLKTIALGGTSFQGIHLGFTAAGKLKLLADCSSELSGTGTENYIQFTEP